MRRRGRRAARFARALTHGSAAVILAGCMNQPQDPQLVEARDTNLTTARAGYVDLMLGNIMGTSGPMDEDGVFAVVANYGGGYITTATTTGTVGTPSEQLSFDTVLGAAAITHWMQGETYGGPSAILCFRFTVGYYPRITHTSVPCPPDASPAHTAALAQRQAAATTTAHAFAGSKQGRAVPLDLAEAEQAAGIGAPSTASVAPTGLASPTANEPLLTSAGFATAHGIAALAVPQTSDACLYILFARAKAANGLPGGLAIRGWAAPTQAACTGSAALTAAGYISNDSRAGG
jgi:hypothetical protein